MADAIEVFDAHFHIWDMTTEEGTVISKSGHDAAILTGVKPDALYGMKEYEADVDFKTAKFKFVGGAFVEAASVCFPDLDGSHETISKSCVVESKWVHDQLSKSSKSYVYVGSVALESPDAANVLKQLKETPNMKGIRQITNFEPNWPRNKTNLFDNEAWQKGYALLKEYDLSFDLQCNPHQFKAAAELAKKHPDTTVILGHLGCVTKDELTDTAKAKVFFDGLKLLAANPNVVLKISMLGYIDPKWDESELVKETVIKAITIFGADRCFFASNSPVDNKDGDWPVDKLYSGFHDIAKDKALGLSEQQQADMFCANAKKAYRVE